MLSKAMTAIFGSGSFITAPSIMLQMMTIVSIIISTQLRYNRLLVEEQRNSQYDYIVVGSGASGSPIAARLSDDPNINVLLIEAGGPQSLISDIPGITEALVDDLEFDWRYPTVPQTEFTGVSMDSNQGRRLGGSSAINGMIYNRGNRRDYDNWVTTYGAVGWSYDELLPYFIRSENNTDPLLVADNPGFHGTSGPIRVSTNPNPAPLLFVHQLALKEWGIPTIDVNGATQVGSTIAQSTAADGHRSSVANMYIDPIADRQNLNILLNSFVTRILFSKSKTGANVAVGVQYIRNEKTFTALAIKEVIICAGPVRSPQLLMVSGIGHRHHLEEFGIPVIADLPVGDNIQEHPSASIHFEVVDPRWGSPGPQLSVEQLYQLWKTRTGPLMFSTDSITYINGQNNDDPNWPNLYFYTVVQNILDLNIQVSEMPGDNYTLLEWQDYFRPFLGKYLLMSAPHIYRVRSWGSIRLQSKDPTVYPLVDPAYLRDPRDKEDFIEITKFIYYFLLHSPLSEYIKQMEAIPGCHYCEDRLPYDCDQYIHCVIRRTGKPGFHLVGGNRMGHPSRHDVVVDPRGRVKQVNRLRVCDSSIMPKLINANTYAASVVIGEKCAHMITQDNQYPK